MITSAFQNHHRQGHTLGEVLAERAPDNLVGITFIDREQQQHTLPYRELLDIARRLAGKLHAHGLREGEPVLIVMDSEEAFVRAFWSVIMAGGMAVPLTAPGSYSAQDPALQKICAVIRQFMAQDQCAPWIISDLDAARMVANGEIANCQQSGRYIDSEASLHEPIGDNIPYTSASVLSGRADDTALLMFSSGSTGDPKGVRLTHRQLLCNLAQIADRSELVSSDRSLSWLPLTHDMGLVLFHLCHTLAGIAQYKMTPLTFARAPGSLLTLASELKASLLGMPNFGFDQLNRLPETDDEHWQLGSVRLIYNGAEPIDPVLTRRFLARFSRYGLDRHVICAGWGIAEACVVASILSCKQLAAFESLPTCWVGTGSALQVGSPVQICPPETPGALELAALGEPVHGLEVRVLDDTRRPLPLGHLGHLEIRGPNVTRGYYGQPSLDWCPTGDIGFLHDGIVYLQGRAKDVLFINGRNFFSNDLETALCHATNWPANQLAVVGHTDPLRRTEQVVVFFRHGRSDGDSAPVAMRLQHALELILGYPVAAAIPVSTLPKTTSGKVRRFVLRNALQEGHYDGMLQEAAAVATTPTPIQRPLKQRELVLAELLRPLLGPAHAHTAIDPAVPLSRYGLDSVGYLQLAAAAGTKDGCEYDAAAWMQAGTLEAIVRCMEDTVVTDTTRETLSVVPLSSRQQVLWLDLQVSPAPPAGLPGRYTEAYWLDLAGELDPDTWLTSARAILDSHPLLSSQLVDGEHGPVLMYLGTPRYELEHAFCPEENLEARSQEIACLPLDLERGPLLRLYLLQAGTGSADSKPRWRVCIQTHHLVADGWSLYLLLNQCLRQEPPAQQPAGLWPEPPELPRALVAAWCRDLLDAGPLLPWACSGGKAPGAVASFRSHLSTHGVQALQRWTSQGHHVFSLIGSTFMALLARIKGQEHSLMGTVASGRRQSSTHQRFGYLARSHAIHATIGSDTTFRTLLASLETQRNDIVAQQTPELCDFVRHPDAKQLTTRIQVVYVHQNMPPLQLPDSLQRLDDGAHRGLARTPLYLTSEWIGQTLRLQWEFDSTLLSQEQVEDLAELLDHMLGEALTSPDTPLSRLSLLSPRQMKAWSAFQGEERPLADDDVVMQRIEQASKRWPLLTAVSDEREALSYSSLLQRVDALCELLRTQYGLQHGERVALLTSRETGYVVGLLALFKLGATAVPLDPALPAQRRMQVLEKSGATLLLGTPSTLATAQSHGLPHAIIDGPPLAVPITRVHPTVQADNAAYLIFTSGSTGTPKGVTICHRSITNLVDWVCRAFHYRAGETMCQFAPFSFDVSMAEILPSLCAGLHVHILPDERRASPQLYLQTMKEQAVQVATLTPAYVAVLNEMPDSCRDSLASLRLLIIGGEALPRDTVRSWRAHSPHVELVSVYGPTETTVMSSAFWIDQELDDRRQIIPLGTPITNTEFWVLDPLLQPCPRGVEGQLYIGGSGLATGYWQDEARTAQAFTVLSPDPGRPVRRFYNSGDRARLAHDGTLEFAGRADNQVKLRGFRIELGDIEQAMLRCPGVQEAVACVIDRTDSERALVAYWRGEETDTRTIAAHLRSCLPTYMQPAAFTRVDQWPLTPNRKIDRRQLPPPAWTMQSAHAAPPAQGNSKSVSISPNETESTMAEALARLWREILGVEHVAPSDEFAMLGGNSLNTARLLNQIRLQLRRDVSLAEVLGNQQLADMAVLLEKAPRLESSTTPAIVTQRERPSFPFAASAAQVRMIYLEREHPGTALNAIPLTLELDADIPRERLHQAMNMLHERHDLLRARFDLQARHPMLHDDAPCPVLEHMQADSEKEAIQMLSTFHAKPYDIERGPLWRVAQACTTAETSPQHWLAISMHHTISDGVTISRLLRELDMLLRGQALPSLDGEAHYADYVEWQTRWLASPDADAARRYWQGGPHIPPLAPLPRHGKRRDPQDVSGRQFVFELDAQGSKNLSALARANAVSPFVLMTTLFSLIIAQQCGVHTMAIGITLSGRSQPLFSQVMGLMVNTLPMAFDWKADESFDALLGRTAERIQRLLSVQDYPLNQALADQHHTGTPFNVFFNEEVLPSTLTLGGGGARLAQAGSGIAKLPIVISCLLMNGRWCARMEIRNDVCPPEWVSSVLASVDRLARNLDGMSGAHLDELDTPDDELLSLLATSPVLTHKES